MPEVIRDLPGRSLRIRVLRVCDHPFLQGHMTASGTHRPAENHLTPTRGLTIRAEVDELIAAVGADGIHRVSPSRKRGQARTLVKRKMRAGAGGTSALVGLNAGG
jgi:hypothetical protein